MAIELATQFQAYTDEQFYSESKTSLVTNKDFSFDGAKTIKLYKVKTTDMEDFNRNGPILDGKSSYIASLLVNFLFKGIGSHWTVELDGETIEDDFSLVSVCNGRYYGGGFMPVAEARMDDGVLETILVKNVPKRTFARLFPAYSAGEYWKFPHIARMVTSRQVVITASPGEADIVTCLDGETIHSRDVRLTLSEKRLNFFGPKGCDPNYGAGPK